MSRGINDFSKLKEVYNPSQGKTFRRGDILVVQRKRQYIWK